MPKNNPNPNLRVLRRIIEVTIPKDARWWPQNVPPTTLTDAHIEACIVQGSKQEIRYMTNLAYTDILITLEPAPEVKP